MGGWAGGWVVGDGGGGWVDANHGWVLALGTPSCEASNRRFLKGGPELQRGDEGIEALGHVDYHVSEAGGKSGRGATLPGSKGWSPSGHHVAAGGGRSGPACHLFAAWSEACEFMPARWAPTSGWWAPRGKAGGGGGAAGGSLAREAGGAGEGSGIFHHEGRVVEGR